MSYPNRTCISQCWRQHRSDQTQCRQGEGGEHSTQHRPPSSSPSLNCGFWDEDKGPSITSDHLASASNSRSFPVPQPESGRPRSGLPGSCDTWEGWQPSLSPSFSSSRWLGFSRSKAEPQMKAAVRSGGISKARGKRERGGGQTRRASEDKRTLGNPAGCQSLRQKTDCRADGWWPPWAPWSTAGSRGTTTATFLHRPTNVKCSQARNISTHFPLDSWWSLFSPCHTFNHVSESCYRWRSIWNNCLNFLLWFHYLKVIEKI